MIFFTIGVFFFITLTSEDQVEISASSATITALSESRVVWLGCLDKSFNMFFESNVERIEDSVGNDI